MFNISMGYLETTSGNIKDIPKKIPGGFSI